jgi:N-hydroxyarylamine O-acetyltransferase
MPFDPDLYFKRIALSGLVKPDDTSLADIHRAQVYHIPFENFDIQLGKPIKLDEASLCTKLLEQNRGGYCFELNGLLQIALSHFGFQVRPLLARVHVSGRPTSRNHQLLLATLSGREWICDVGFGANGLRAPIPFELNQPRSQDGQTFRLVEDEAYGYMLQNQTNNAWQNLYSFDLLPAFPIDIELGNYFTSTSPSSFFVTSRTATLPTPEGRVALNNFTLREITKSDEQVTALPADQGYLDALEKHFSITLNVPYSALKPIPDVD